MKAELHGAVAYLAHAMNAARAGAATDHMHSMKGLLPARRHITGTSC